jgi:hypothetical protein
MTHANLAAAAPTPAPTIGSPGGSYQPGVCNIGPAEIARRRQAGHIGLALTAVVLAAVLVAHVPPLVRLIVILPAGASASGYLQAIFKFCAGFGSRGIFNFGPLGQTEQVADPESLRRDRARSRQLGIASLAVGIVVGILAVALPL